MGPPWTFFGVRQGMQGVGTLRHACAVGPSRTLQTASDPAGEESALFSRDAVEEGMALEEAEVSGIRQVFQLLVEDIIEEVDVVVEE